MLSERAAPDQIPTAPAELYAAIDARYGESGGDRFGITEERFREHVFAAVTRYGSGFSPDEQKEMIATLRVEELTLARACSEGNEDAWREFLERFRGEMTRAAVHIAQGDATGRELADELYAELYGLPNREGRRVSKLDSYMGRGSLAGWLRSVLAQRFVDRCRMQAKETSLDEQMDAGVAFAAAPESWKQLDDRVALAIRDSMGELDAEDRFLLSAYYLDGQKLAEIGKQLSIHESTVSRKLDKLTKTLRKRVRKRLLAGGMDIRACDELLRDLDVRDVNVDVRATLQQETKLHTF